MASIVQDLRHASGQLRKNPGFTDMEKLLADSTAERRFVLILFEALAVVALALATSGIYGVLSGRMAERTREIGVRMALGAQRKCLLRLILLEASWLVAVGIVAGLTCSVGPATLIHGLLFGVRSWDAATLAAVACVLAVFALLASYIPASRASEIDPMEALRYE